MNPYLPATTKVPIAAAMSGRLFACLAFVQIAFAVALVTAWFWIRTEALLASPSDGDLYAHTAGFQWVLVYPMFLIPVLAIAFTAVRVEYALIYRKQ